MAYHRDSWRGIVTKTIPLRHFRETDGAYDNPLTSAATATAFGLAGGTHGTGSPKLQGKAANADTTTSKGRFEFTLPPEYAAGGVITLRVHIRMSAAPAVSATLDAEVFKTDREAGAGSDICATAAQAITTWADKDFTITPTGLAAGDTLDVELTTVVNDTGGGGAFVAQVGSVQMLLMERF